MGARVCVVVSAYDRAVLLPDLVAALQAQTVEDFEAILVDNGSSDDTYHELCRLTADDRRFRVLQVDGNRGPARARNLAWRTTDCPWVAFTDDDCAPAPTWLAELLDASAGAGIVQGRTIPPPSEEQPIEWFDRPQRIERWSGRFETCNLLVDRRLLEVLDGFDERFHLAMGEDTDFGLRAVARGARTAFADGAVVHHHVWRSGFRGFLQHRRRYSACVELFRVNPSARVLLKWRFAVRGVHLLIWGLLPLGLVSARYGAPWVPLVAVAAWCTVNVHRTRERPVPWIRRFGYSLAQFVGYVYETWCFALASVRYGTLVV